MAAAMELREIATDVYACLQADRGLGWSNSGLVNRGGGLVVDTFWDLPHTRELIAHYARVWRRPGAARREHAPQRRPLLGQPALRAAPRSSAIGGAPRRSARERARRPCRCCASAAGQRRPGDRRRSRAQLADWDFTGIELTPPTTLFDDRLDLDLDGVAVELRLRRPGAHRRRRDRAPARASASCSPATCSSASARRSAGKAPTRSGSRRSTRSSRSTPTSSCRATGRSAASKARARCAPTSTTCATSRAATSSAGVPALEAAKRIDLGPYARLDRAGAALLQRRARLPRAPRRALRRADRRDGDVPRHVRAPRALRGAPTLRRRRIGRLRSWTASDRSSHRRAAT